MADDIPFNKQLDLKPDTVDEAMPGVRRVMADNPGPFTFKGTLSYIVGRGTVYAEGLHRAARPLHIGEHNPLDASADRGFRPDVTLKDGEVVAGDRWTIGAVTP